MKNALDSSTECDQRQLFQYPLIEALLQRRSRRFAAGMKMESGPLAYKSRFAPVPVSETEEAALAFAACGITGHALADLCYGKTHGGNIMAGLVGRTIASGDAIQTTALFVSNDEATYLLKRPENFTATELAEIIDCGKKGAFLEAYQRSRVKIKDGRAAAPLEPAFNINVNRWSLYAPGTSYFLPVNDLTLMYINGLLEIFNEDSGVFLLDERAGFRPAGIGKFAVSKGGHLHDDPAHGKVATIHHAELMIAEFVAIEQGMMLQNLGLMAQALGLGGFPHFANHEFGWFQALGFRMGEMAVSRYLAANWLTKSVMRLLGRDQPVPFPLGLEKDGEILLRPFCQPYFSSMTEAVQAVVDRKFGPEGVFRRSNCNPSWKAPDAVSRQIPSVSDAAISATIAYCEYVYQRYGRFPAYLCPFRTVVGYQACHLDLEFYEQFYQPSAISNTQRQDFARWNNDRK